ncbi:MAG: ATP-binding cassette domain-containing protein [Actinomycetes bacterium]
MTMNAAPSRKDPVFELRDVSFSYGSNEVIHQVSLGVAAGEVVGLIGDNGAGKSTLLKLFAGFQIPTQGTLAIDGMPVKFRSPAAARSLGVEAVYQDLAIIEQLSIWRNFYLGKELVKKLGPFRFLDKAAMRNGCIEALQLLGLTRIRSVDGPAWAMSGGERQSLAITRAMSLGARILLLDEPTAALSVRQTRNVLDSIQRAASAGLGVLYIDHNMDHVAPVADRVVVLDHGRIIVELTGDDINAKHLGDLVAERREELSAE